MKKYDYVCEECGGKLLVEAWVVWDADDQEFHIAEVFRDQTRYCDTCDNEAEIKEVEIEE